jgi:hypothetical protein
MPSVQGRLLAGPVGEIERLLERGEAPREELHVRLQADDLAILETKVEPGRWYSIDSYRRISDWADDKVGRRRREDHVEQGRQCFERLSGSGEYQELASRIEDWGGKFGFFGITVWSSFYNFMRWELEESDRAGCFDITVSGTRPLPDTERFRLQGFIEAHTSFATSGPAHVSSERPTPGTVVFHIVAERFRRAY